MAGEESGVAAESAGGVEAAAGGVEVVAGALAGAVAGGLVWGLFCGLLWAYPVKTKLGASSKLLATINSAGISFLRILLIIISRGLTQADHALAIRPSMRVLASLRPGISAKG
jgi:hypothetical protein